METIQLVLKLGKKGESDRQNWNMRVAFQNKYVLWGMGKNYAVVGIEANLQARYIGKNKVINSTLKCHINRGDPNNHGRSMKEVYCGSQLA